MMKKALIAIMPAAALLAGGASVANAEEKLAPPPSEFSPIQRYAITFDRPRDVAEFYLREYGLKSYGVDFEQLDHETDDTLRVLLITVDPIKNETVRGVQWRLDMRRMNGAWRTVDAGIRRKCTKGADTTQWTKDTCPQS